MSNPLVLLAADTFGMALHYVGEGKVRGSKARKMKIGYWELDSGSEVCSDELVKKYCTFIMRVRGDVWAYFIFEEDKTVVFFFDGSKWKLKSKDVAYFGTGVKNNTLRKIKEQVRCVFGYTASGKIWGELDVDTVDEVIEGKDIIVPLRCVKAVPSVASAGN